MPGGGVMPSGMDVGRGHRNGRAVARGRMKTFTSQCTAWVEFAQQAESFMTKKSGKIVRKDKKEVSVIYDSNSDARKGPKGEQLHYIGVFDTKCCHFRLSCAHDNNDDSARNKLPSKNIRRVNKKKKKKKSSHFSTTKLRCSVVP